MSNRAGYAYQWGLEQLLCENGTAKKAGTIGHIGCTSFFPSKNLGCYGDGGALFTNDSNLAKRITSLANHGMEVRYYHDYIGINSRLDSIQAAILNVKLKHLIDFNQKRAEVARFYSESLSQLGKVIIPSVSNYTNHVFHQFTIIVSDGKRDALKAFLADKGIPSMVYYPVPLHQQKAFATFRASNWDFPVSEQLSKEVLSLPMHPNLTNDQLKYIVENIISFFK